MTRESMTRALIAAGLGLALLTAPAANGAVYSGSTTDGTDPKAAVDIRELSTTIDTDAGTWSTEYVFEHRRTAKTRADIQLGFNLPDDSRGRPVQGGYVLLKIRGFKTTWDLHNESLGPNDEKPDDLVEATRDGRRLTVVVTDPRLVGVTPARLNRSRASYRYRNFEFVRGFSLEPADPATAPSS